MNVNGVTVPIALVFDTIEGIITERKKKPESADNRKVGHHGQLMITPAGGSFTFEERHRGLHQGGAKIGLKPKKRETITTRYQWNREEVERDRMAAGAAICAMYQALSRQV